MPRIVDLSHEHHEAYLRCLEAWSAETDDGRDRKAAWYEKMRNQGLFVKIALDDDQAPVGMIQVLPIERSSVQGEDLTFILCIWVHGHQQGVGNRQGRGLGTMLLAAAEAEARARGAKGMAAWGMAIPVWMRARWYRRHGYEVADRRGGMALVWKPFAADARPPRFLGEGPPPQPVPGQVTVTCYTSGWCTGQDGACARAKQAAAACGPTVVYREIDTSEPGVAARLGHADAIYVDGRPLTRGAPPSREAIERAIQRRLRGRIWTRRVRAAVRAG